MLLSSVSNITSAFNEFSGVFQMSQMKERWVETLSMFPKFKFSWEVFK